MAVRGVQAVAVAACLGVWGWGLAVMGGVWFGDGVPAALAFGALALLGLGAWSFYVLPECAFFLLTRLGLWQPLSTPGTRRPGAKPPLPARPRVALLYTTADDFSESAVESLLRQEGPSPDVYVLDDGVLPGTRRRIDDFAARNPVRVLRRGRRRDYKAGNLNDALEAIGDRYDLFAVLDGDTTASADFTQRCVAAFVSPAVGFVMGRKLPYPHQRSGLAGILRHLIPVWYEGVLPAEQNLGMTIFDGHGGMLRVDGWREAGGFPATSTEDIALAIRMRARGWCGVYEPRAISWSEFPESVAQLFKRNEKWTRGLLDTLARHGGELFRSPHPSIEEKLDLVRLSLTHLAPMLALATVVCSSISAWLDPAVADAMLSGNGPLVIATLMCASVVPVVGSLWSRPHRLMGVVAWSILLFLGGGLRNGIDVIGFASSRSSVFGVTAGEARVELGERRRRLGWWAQPKSSDPQTRAVSLVLGLCLLAFGVSLQVAWLTAFGLATLCVEALCWRFQPVVGWSAALLCLGLFGLLTAEMVRVALL